MFMSVLYWGVQNRTRTPDECCQCNLIPLIQPRVLLTFFCCRGALLTHVNLVYTSSFSVEAFSSQAVHSLYLGMGLFLSRKDLASTGLWSSLCMRMLWKRVSTAFSSSKFLHHTNDVVISSWKADRLGRHDFVLLIFADSYYYRAGGSWVALAQLPVMLHQMELPAP